MTEDYEENQAKVFDGRCRVDSRFVILKRTVGVTNPAVTAIDDALRSGESLIVGLA